ncbi:MAG: diguanylate cyclase [Holophagaceae bacterium]|nr:diguanylate cyclase [Holophagaceae bacterium]
MTNLATTCLTQDDEGYVWVGTEGGLFRYDGQRFKHFGLAEGLSDLLVNDVQPIPGGLFVFTQSGPMRFDGQRFQPWGAKDGVPEKGFACVARDGAGQVWMGTLAGLSLSKDGGRTFQPVKDYPAGGASALWVDPKDGTLFAVHRRGKPGERESSMVRRQGNSWSFLELPEELRKQLFNCGRVDRAGAIWIRGGSRLVRFAAWGAKPEDLSSLLPGKPVASGDGLSLDHEGRVWAATDSGLACFEKGRVWILDEGHGLPSAWANATLTDREGSLWVAAEGLHRLQGRFLWTAFTRKQGLPVDAVWNLHRGRDGELWAATPRGMARLKDGGWILVPETHERSFYAIAESPDGGVWAGGQSAERKPNTLFYRAPGQAAFKEILLQSVKRNTVTSLAAGLDGTIWIGTQGAGLHRLRKAPGNPGGAFVCELANLPGGSEATVNRVLVDQEGLVWTAGDHGLGLFDGRSWRHFGPSEGLKDPNPSGLARDAKGNLWVAYWTAHGLTRLSRNGGVWQVAGHVQEPAELFQDDIVSLDCDSKGVLWFGTTQGVKRWQPEHQAGGAFERYGRSQGLPGDDCTANALLLEPSGDVWVGLSAGIAQFHSAYYHGPPQAPKARIILMKEGSGRMLPLGENLRIPYRWRSVDLAFASPSFQDESHLKAQFRLAGFEDEWRDTAAREARYTTLPAGSYRFEVRFGDANGQFGEPSTQSFQILAPWWQKPWFFLLAGLAATGLILLIIRRRTALLLRRTQELEALVRQRTTDLLESNAALHQANLALEESSMLDALTGLRNRRFLGLHMPDEEVRVLRVYRNFLESGEPGLPKGEDLVLLLVDLDHFKFVNDTHGHAAGDQVLKEAAEVLRKACREADTVVRWGGEEFLVVARRTDRAAALNIARKIRETMEAHRFNMGGGKFIQRTCSVGFSAFPLLPGHPGTFHWEDAVEIADQCLYAVKRSGRNGWVGLTCETVDADLAWAPRMLTDLPGLAKEGKLVLRTSYDNPESLVW